MPHRFSGANSLVCTRGSPDLDRRLAAILAADVVGYSRLMEQNEAETFERLRAHRKELFEPEIERHHGRIFKLMGDGVLAEFASVVNAVECALTLQRCMAERNAGLSDARRIDVRIGINLGGLRIINNNIHGDGVNMAARLQALAHAGGVVVSGTVYDQLQGKLGLPLDFVGEQRVKNIARPVRVYRVLLDGGAAKTAPPLPDKPSIAVLPFENLSGDPEQEYFADGIVEEIITALSRFHGLFVIARNSSFTYKGRVVDVKQVGRELGVRYVLEGSVRKAANRVRITGQLIDAASGAHLWADRFDGALEDIFDLQDQVTERVVGAIGPKLEQAEIERAKLKPTENLDAYDYYLRGLASLPGGAQEDTGKGATGTSQALPLFLKAIELDRDFALAYGLAAQCYVIDHQYGLTTNRAQAVAEVVRLARRAAALGKDDATALTRAGHALGYVLGEVEEGATLLDRALLLNPNLALAWNFGGWSKIFLGQPEIAIERMARAMRLNPLDPLLFLLQAGTAFGHLFAGRYDEAASWAEKALRERPNFPLVLRLASASFSLSGRVEEAHKLISRLRQINPMLRVQHVKDLFPLRRPEDLARYIEGLRKAGLPE